MTLQYPIVSIENATENDYTILSFGINAHATSLGFNANNGSYFFAVYDDQKRMIAGISGYDNFGVVEIGGLWVDEHMRNQGYGKSLIEKAIEWGHTCGCQAIAVFTLKEWPACSWYQSLGFCIEFERAGHANKMTGCYLIKKI